MNKKNVILSKLLQLGLFIVCVGLAFNANAQQTITGKLTNKDGQALPVVNVIVKGTNIGELTDDNGGYTITVPANIKNPTLIYSFIGFIEKQELVNNRSVVNITLEDEISKLDEVIVVGYTTQRRESVTGALTAVRSDKLMDASTPSVANMLGGKAPGVFVSQSSGQPGAKTDVVIRGKTTVNGSTDPLWVIDGVIVGSDAGYLNPNDIETISILKDAASTAIYGSAGSNGVIVVTTKRAKAGTSVVTFSSKLSLNTLARGNFEMMNSTELADQFAKMNAPLDAKYRNQYYDWFDEGTHTGLAQEYNLSISGGTDRFKTYTSLSYYKEDGAVIGYELERLNGRFNMEYKVNDFLTIRPNVAISRNDIDDTQHSIGDMYRNMPWDSPYAADGHILSNAEIRAKAWQNSTKTNYMYDRQFNYVKSRSYETLAGFDADIKLTSFLSFTSTNNYKFQNFEQQTYMDPRSSGGANDKGNLKNDHDGYYRFFTNQMFKFNKSFDKHFISAIAAYEFNEFRETKNEAAKGGVPPGFPTQDVGSTNKLIKGNAKAWAVQSYLFNGNYSYDNRYLGQLSLRRDGASNFGRNKQYGNFFSVSGGWNLHNEAFYTLKDVINVFKIRASYGSTGNRPKSLYPQYGMYSLDTSYDEETGAILNQLPNPDLTWEKTYTTGIGFDFRFLDRIGLTIDLYDKNTSDLLQEAPLPGVVGVTKIWRNVGEVNNKGFEVTVSADIIKNQDLQWNAELNIGLNRNKITKLYGGKDLIVGTGTVESPSPAGASSKILREGEDVDSWYTYEWLGVDPANGKPLWNTVADTATSVYSRARMVIAGSSAPDFVGGFNSSLSYKGISLSASFNFVVGNKLYNYSRNEFDSDGAYSDRNQQRLYKDWTRWEKPGDIATHPELKLNGNNNAHKESSRFIENGSYLRLRNVTLAYDIPLRYTKFATVRAYVTGENLLTFTKFSGIDPEVGSKGIASDIYPVPRRFVFGLNVTF